MTDAITIFYSIFDKIYNLIFNQAVIVEGVSVGWVFIVVLIFGILIRMLLNIPSGVRK